MASSSVSSLRSRGSPPSAAPFVNRKLSYVFQTDADRDPRDYKLQSTGRDELTLTTTKATSVIKAKAVPTVAIYTIPVVPQIVDQGDVGSCVCNSAYYLTAVQTNNAVKPSRLMLYALCRIMDDTSLDQDVGTTIPTCCNVLRKYGACSETTYGYDVTKFDQLPPLAVLKSLALFRSFSYYAVNPDLATLKQCLTTFKTPITFGIMVYDSFLTQAVAQTGVVPMPNKVTEKVQGGHCVTMVGYNDTKSAFLCANTWGTGWGQRGFFYLPYAYVTDRSLASDFYRYTLTV